MSTIPAAGTYRLTVDVQNPTPGRYQNKRFFPTQATWPAGMVFQVCNKSKSGDVFLTVPSATEGYLDQDDERFAAVIAHLEPIPETPSLWLTRVHKGHDAVAILDRLVASGQITLADVQRASNEP